MSNQEQTKCPKCKLQYNQTNLPRLLTMCGHTFCEKCIRELMVKKKLNTKYKIICPLDRMMIEVSSPNPTTFPKNLSLLNLVKKKSDSNLANNRISDIQKSPQNVGSLGSGTTIRILQNQLETNNTIKNFVDQQKDERRISFFQQQILSQTCLLHQKPLQLVCVRDFQKICCSCVIFGQHRGHTVKNINQVQDLSKKLTQRFKKYLDDLKLHFKRLESKQIQQKIEEMFKKKKNELHKQVIKKFKQLLQFVILTQKKTLSKLDRKLSQYRNKIYNSLNQKILVKDRYKDWEQNLKQKIQSISCQNQQIKLKITLKSQNFIQVCEKNIEVIKSLQLDLFDETDKQLDNFALNTDDQQIRRHIKQYCKFEDCKNSFLGLNSSRVNVSHILNQQILIDDIHQASLSHSFLKVNQKQDNQYTLTKNKKMTSSSIFTNTLQPNKQSIAAKTMRVKSSNKQRFFLSPNRKNSSLKSNKLLVLGNNRPSLNNLLRLKDVPQKYESKIDAVLKGTSDVLDLTNAELGSQLILTILQHIKDNSVAIIKLVRNKINDQCFIKSIPFLNNTVMLNVSKNQLTQRSLQYLFNARKQGGLIALKSLMIGQNKIIERKNKQIFQQLKKLGINVCI